MIKSILTTVLILAALVSIAQTKPRKVVIHKYESIRRDSTIYLPDTIACYFKELVISPDTVYEKWNKGFIIWQTWIVPNYGISTYLGSAGTWTGLISGSRDDKPIENPYDFPEKVKGRFLYSNYKQVTNKIIYTIKR